MADITNLDANFKKVYADKINGLIVPNAVLQKRVKFQKSKKQGGAYVQPISGQLSHGVTYFPSSENGAPPVNPSVSAALQSATVSGSQFLLQDTISFAALSRSDSPNAFIDATKFVVKNMKESADRKLEATLFHGGMGLGKVGAVSGTTVTIAEGEFAAGVWQGAVNMRVEFYNGGTARLGGSTLAPTINTSTVFTVTGVDIGARTITLNAAPTGLAAGDDIFEAGAKGNQFLGLHGIQATAAGNLFGVPVSGLWKANVVDFGAVAGNKRLTIARLEKAILPAVNNGLTGDVSAYVSYETFADMISDENELRRYTAPAQGKQYATAGFEGLKVIMAGVIMTVVPSSFVKRGYAHIVKDSDLLRVGSTDITFNRPGANGDQFFMELEGYAGVALRCYYDQALFLQNPGQSVLVKGIVNGDTTA